MMKRFLSIFSAFVAALIGVAGNAFAALDFSTMAAIDIGPVEALTMLMVVALVGMWICKVVLSFLARSPR